MSVYHFEMEMCCSMQVRSLIHELELCKQVQNWLMMVRLNCQVLFSTGTT